MIPPYCPPSKSSTSYFQPDFLGVALPRPSVDHCWNRLMAHRVVFSLFSLFGVCLKFLTTKGCGEVRGVRGKISCITQVIWLVSVPRADSILCQSMCLECSPHHPCLSEFWWTTKEPPQSHLVHGADLLLVRGHLSPSAPSLWCLLWHVHILLLSSPRLWGAQSLECISIILAFPQDLIQSKHSIIGLLNEKMNHVKKNNFLN